MRDRAMQRGNVRRGLAAAVLLLALSVVQQASAVPKIEAWETANGARVLFVEARELPMLDVRVIFDAGSARDGALPGLASLTNALLPDGAGPWNTDAIAERLESVGSEFDIGAARDMAWVTARTLTEPAPLEMA